MGTDVNPVAWENAEIMVCALIDGNDNKFLLDNGFPSISKESIKDIYLTFCSYVGHKHGEFKVISRPDQLEFKLGDKSYIWEYSSPLTANHQLVKILYEVFYKHQF